MIEALVLSTCFYNQIKMFGCIYELQEEIKDVKHIYATSGGAIIGLIFALKIDMDIAFKYIHMRPWLNILNIENINIYRKGLLDNSVFRKIIEPLLLSKNLTADTTLKELYLRTDINLNIFTTKMIGLKKVCLSHTTYPDLSILNAIAMSCSIPYLFEPVYYKEEFYIDGAICCSYPIIDCLSNHKRENILGLKTESKQKEINISDTSNIVEYITTLSNEIFGGLMKEKNEESKEQHNQSLIHNQILIYNDEISMNLFYEVSKSKELRLKYINDGIELAKEYKKQQRLF